MRARAGERGAVSMWGAAPDASPPGRRALKILQGEGRGIVILIYALVKCLLLRGRVPLCCHG